MSSHNPTQTAQPTAQPTPLPRPWGADAPASTSAAGAAAPRHAAELGPLVDAAPTRVQLARIDPWSVLVTTLTLATVLALLWVGACALLYVSVARLGAVTALNDVYNTLVVPAPEDGPAPVGPITLPRTLLVSGVLGAAGIVFAATMTTLAAAAYNVCARITKGVRITLNCR